MEIINELSSEAVDIIVVVPNWLMPEMKGDEFSIQVHQRFPQISKVMPSEQVEAAATERLRLQANLQRCLFSLGLKRNRSKQLNQAWPSHE